MTSQGEAQSGDWAQPISTPTLLAAMFMIALSAVVNDDGLMHFAGIWLVVDMLFMWVIRREDR